jgi:5-methylcytosine-specific restriction endonuclease McrA
MTIEEAIETSASMAEAARKMNMSFSTFKRKAGDLYKPNQSGKGITKKFVRNRFSEKVLTEDILKGLRPQYPTTKLKIRLIDEGYLECKCVWCNATDTWNNKPLVLQLDHINGVNNDHRLENLRLLCPNCHSQTDTWAGRGSAKKK